MQWLKPSLMALIVLLIILRAEIPPVITPSLSSAIYIKVTIFFTILSLLQPWSLEEMGSNYISLCLPNTIKCQNYQLQLFKAWYRLSVFCLPRLPGYVSRLVVLNLIRKLLYCITNCIDAVHGVLHCTLPWDNVSQFEESFAKWTARICALVQLLWSRWALGEYFMI